MTDINDKQEIMRSIDKLRDELKVINIKQQCYTETICHLRARVAKCERRKAEIHNEILDIRDMVKAWEAARSSNESNSL